MAAHTKVIPNNCVSEIKVPRIVESAYGVDYNPVLGLYATFNYDFDKGISVWDPTSGKVVAENIGGVGEAFRDVLFVPGDRILVSSAHFGQSRSGSLEIFNLDKDKSDSAEFVKEDEDKDEDEDEGGYKDEGVVLANFLTENEDLDLPSPCPGALAWSPARNLLLAGEHNKYSGGGVYEIFIDWDNLKVLKSREIIPEVEDDDSNIILLCCSPDYKVTTFSYDQAILSSAKVSFNSEGEAEIQAQEKITYYVLNGEEKHIGEGLAGLVHDGKNLIIANEDEIVLLESMTEGSIAHLIASGVKYPGQIRLNHEGQLMVCEGEVIKLFDYKCNLRSLQDICRCHIRKTIHADYMDKVNGLEIPSMLKNYLLFKY
ncbi:uncharacterized protein LOC144643480 [Oculina patagonica]